LLGFESAISEGFFETAAAARRFLWLVTPRIAPPAVEGGVFVSFSVAQARFGAERFHFSEARRAHPCNKDVKVPLRFLQLLVMFSLFRP
jgi:hypothetical protein